MATRERGAVGRETAAAVTADAGAGEEFEPAGFAASLGLKDVRLVLAAAEQLQVPLPVASLLRDRLLTLVATGGGHLDWSALATLADRDAGVKASKGSDHSA